VAAGSGSTGEKTGGGATEPLRPGQHHHRDRPLWSSANPHFGF
jgi:hypothetical protein